MVTKYLMSKFKSFRILTRIGLENTNMSHFTTIKTKILDKTCLIEALQNNNFNVQENVSILGYRGRKKTGEVVIKTGKNYDVGFVKSTDGSYEMVADWYGAARAVGNTPNKFLNEIQREYATQKIINAIRKRGYRLQSRKNTETGEIKLLVVKRGGSR